jgi:NADP-dependent 3-hydroxy acid dehydrogenase YdfG
MKNSRHHARTVALQGLFQLDIQEAAPDADVLHQLAPLVAQSELSGDAADYARGLVAGVWSGRDRYDEMIRLNCAAPVRLTRLLLPGMLARGRGAVVMLASTASFQPVPYLSV